MQQRLKQRLIGAAVLVALAVIFLPMLLTGPSDRHTMDVPIEIPQRPQMTEVPGIPEPADIEQLAERQPSAPPVERPSQTASAPAGQGEEASEEPAELEVVEVEPPAVAAAEETQSSPQAVDSDMAAWAIQVGSFGRESNAFGLRDRLREAGFSAYVEAPEAQGSRFYRVRVGPVVERDEADALKTRLQEEEGLPGLVVSHP
ncbi:hypothetical protein CAI21_02595 [Alkalilimnicola ehrlichii]|uniref:SPOR domain-containing protein n=1 Tax=Alkalilimnicola ehrlichii TaxID=351052 RepID=A0A3E0X0N3_9GAMM|nr:SPOR domain-containing protein [Alkalilimnicola ehrlichii]RFA30888.1 hypothetical protein CAI21_02595 [Alkalilimnicola ehrlichii]RFA38838.1 hypothetical protein CAL65_02740 [Alkalilimnicola ehrlichii]